MVQDAREMARYYMTCRNYFLELEKKHFDSWFSTYYSILKSTEDPILDIGCGVGQAVNRLANEGFQAVGVDVSPIGLLMASRQGKAMFVVATADNLPFKTGIFATAGFFDFLEHARNPERCLGEMVRVVKTGGKVVASAPNFLRIIGLSLEYHWHMRGPKHKILNFLTLVRKFAFSRVLPTKMRFDFMAARLDYKGLGGDMDAVCVTNPLDIKFRFKQLGVKILRESATADTPMGIIRWIGRMPLIRSISSFSYILGIKQDGSSSQE